eukprot:TRINITY_DN12452_c0_g1_i2.p1 TRINITY_DN12452_c0_g1~~TRINITY_DN12452_c0_g1_i2.p1  ORF type:complete len:668 (+),score=154.67 TRINITY_DN12452_c0_g1_i2:69-2072(+)
MDKLMAYINERGSLVNQKIQAGDVPTAEQLHNFVSATVSKLKELTAGAPSQVQQKLAGPWTPFWDFAANRPGTESLEAAKLLDILRKVRDAFSGSPAAKAKAAAGGYKTTSAAKKYPIEVRSILTSEVITVIEGSKGSLQIAQLKSEIARELNVPAAYMKLLDADGRELDARSISSTLRKNGLEPGSFVQLQKLAPSEKDMNELGKLFEKPTQQRREAEERLFRYLLNWQMESEDVNGFLNGNEFIKGWSLLHCVVHAGLEVECAKLLANESFTAIDTTTYMNRSALHIGVIAGQAECCKLLLRSPRFSMADALSSEGSALHCAVWHSPKMAQVLLAEPRFTALNTKAVLTPRLNGMPVQGNYSALELAFLLRQLDLAALMLQDARVDAESLNQVDPQNGSLLHQCSCQPRSGSADTETCIKLLLSDDRFSAVDAVDSQDCTALHMFALKNMALAAELLLSDSRFSLVNHKATVSFHEKSSGEEELCFEATALHCAAIADSLSICQLLLNSPAFTVFNAQCAEPNYQGFSHKPTTYGFTALHCAAFYGNSEACKALMASSKFDVNAKAHDGRTALHVGADPWNIGQESRYVVFCKELLSCKRFVEAGCSLASSEDTSKGSTALDVALRYCGQRPPNSNFLYVMDWQQGAMDWKSVQELCEVLAKACK